MFFLQTILYQLDGLMVPNPPPHLPWIWYDPLLNSQGLPSIRGKYIIENVMYTFGGGGCISLFGANVLTPDAGLTLVVQ